MEFQKIETSQLVLRRPEDADSQEFYFLRTDERVNQFVTRERPVALSDASAFIRNINMGIEEGKCFYWCICLANKPRAIGTICLWNMSSDRKVAEVGYELRPDFQGRGFMSEALQAVLLFGFHVLELDTILAITHVSNYASARLLERTGFHLNQSPKDGLNPDELGYQVSRKRTDKNLRENCP
ncbi:MAG TPA: GNAT family N-acetyltransferase [Puia sp.]|nr:GNAT family N-acetyltransferase [Puia sp.]